MSELGLEVRAGLHTGECQQVDGKFGGHRRAHRRPRGGAGRPWARCSCRGTVKDLVAGSGIEFGDRGVRELKGIPGEWRLFSVESA